MKKSFQKSLVAVALIAAGFAAHAGTAGTSNLLFPYVTTATGAFTFISISQQNSSAPTTGTAASPLHFSYATKPISAANSAKCDHVDGDATSTLNDLMQFEVSKRIDVPAAFGDTTSVPKYLYEGNPAAANRHGTLIVNAAAGSAYPAGGPYTSPALYGEARIISTASGLAAGYSTDDLHATAAPSNPDFTAGGPDQGLSSKVVSWFAEPTVSTTFYVLPLGTEANMSFSGNLFTSYQVQGATPSVDSTLGFGGHYNNNEKFQSSTNTNEITCLGVVSRSNLLGSLNAPFSANGGWGNLTRVTDIETPTGLVTATNSLVYKLETTSAVGNASFVTRVPTK